MDEEISIDGVSFTGDAKPDLDWIKRYYHKTEDNGLGRGWGLGVNRAGFFGRGRDFIAGRGFGQGFYGGRFRSRGMGWNGRGFCRRCWW